jgi:hypothetical protein
MTKAFRKTHNNLGSMTTFHRTRPSKESMKILFKTALIPEEVAIVEMILFYNHKEIKKYRYEK